VQPNPKEFDFLSTFRVREEEEDQKIHCEKTWKGIGVILVKAGEN
jgi:hypothetical protein